MFLEDIYMNAAQSLLLVLLLLFIITIIGLLIMRRHEKKYQNRNSVIGVDSIIPITHDIAFEYEADGIMDVLETEPKMRNSDILIEGITDFVCSNYICRCI